MKVLFLDCDGVINCAGTFTKKHDEWFPVDPYMVLLVDRIIQATGCKVVLSSSWRHHPQSVELINKRIVELYDKTPDLDGFRGNEVKAWIDSHTQKFGGNVETEITKYAILDDDSDFHPDQPLFQTSWQTGLTDEIAAKVIEHLNS